MRTRSTRAALVAALVVAARGAVAAPSPQLSGAALAAGCVSGLHDIHTGEGEKKFASHYVIDGSFGYGEFVVGSFGGQSLWKKRGDYWCRIETGSAVLDRMGILKAGVPADVADRLLVKMRDGREIAPPLAAGPLPGVPHR